MSTDAQALVLTRGYPGSGKSTEAEQWIAGDPENRVSVNRDDLRLAICKRQTKLSFAQEQAVTVAQHAAVRALLAAGKSVIVDDTNLKLKYARAYADIAAELGVAFTVWDVTTPVEECVLRDRVRSNTGGRGVGEAVIRDIAARFPVPWPEVTPTKKREPWSPTPYERDLSLPEAWLFDVDGTLAHNDGHRGWYEWSKVGDDEPVEDVLTLARALRHYGFALVVMSGRDEECRPETEAWLAEHIGTYAELHMRAAGDHRSDDIVKDELFDKHVRYRWNVYGVVDDRPKVCRMWRAKGLTVAQVGDPHIEF